MTAEQVTKGRYAYIERFTRFEYAGAFERCKSECTLLFAELGEHPELTGTFAAELVDYADAHSRGFFKRSTELDIFRRYFALYLIPAALESGVADFGQELCTKWNAAYPKQSFTVIPYSEIATGFRTKPFGMG